MLATRLQLVITALAVTSLAGCERTAAPANALADSGQAVRPATWLEGAADRDDALIRHLRGLDVAMIEIDQRYAELYWAGRDRNWPYATYQLDKLRLVMDLALERRPPRAASSRVYYDPALAGVREAVERQDPALFDLRFAALVAACNNCHAAERVPSFHVAEPTTRRSSIQPPRNAGGAGNGGTR